MGEYFTSVFIILFGLKVKFVVVVVFFMVIVVVLVVIVVVVVVVNVILLVIADVVACLVVGLDVDVDSVVVGWLDVDSVLETVELVSEVSFSSKFLAKITKLLVSNGTVLVLDDSVCVDSGEKVD